MRFSVLLQFFSSCCWLSIALSGCSYDPVPINYGKDVCDNCRMQIEDRGYGREIVSPKGKIYPDSTRANACSSSCPTTVSGGPTAPAHDRSQCSGNLIDARSAYYPDQPATAKSDGAGLRFPFWDSLQAFH